MQLRFRGGCSSQFRGVRVADGKEGEQRPFATVQTYVLAKYNADGERMVKEDFLSWKALMKECLTGVFGE